MNKKKIGIIGASSGWGAKNRRTEEGPEALQAMGLIDQLKIAGIDATWLETVQPRHYSSGINLKDPHKVLELVADFNETLYEVITKTIRDNYFPVILGGDHSIAVGTWNAVAVEADVVGRFGLIWIDAHMDAHTMKTSPSKASHGMPVACLLGYGASELVDMGCKGQVIKPENLVQIGVRSWEEEEALIHGIGVRVYMIEEIEKRGFAEVLREAIKLVTKNTDAFGVSIDLDAFDPSEAPGVGSPVDKGLSTKAVIESLGKLANHPKFIACEIVEYNPCLDKGNKTGQLTIDLLKAMLKRERINA